MTLDELSVSSYRLPDWAGGIPGEHRVQLSEWRGIPMWAIHTGDAVMIRTGEWKPIPPAVLQTPEWVAETLFDNPQAALSLYWMMWRKVMGSKGLD